MNERAGDYRPIAVDQLPATLAGYLAAVPGTVRVAIDGAPAADPDPLAAALADALPALGRSAAWIRADGFWRDASLRLEYGRTDDFSLLHSWLDEDALRREVLNPLGPGGSGCYLPSLRDPATNRATRAAAVLAPPEAIIVVSGQFLLGHGLPFDRTIHLSLSDAALARRTPADGAWTLAAFAGYEAETDPSSVADVVVRLNDPRHPAIRMRT